MKAILIDYLCVATAMSSLIGGLSMVSTFMRKGR